MSELEFQHAGDLLMPNVVEPGRQDPAGRCIRFRDHHMPVAVSYPLGGSGLPVFDHQRQRRVEPKLLPERLGCTLELVTVDRDLRCNDEMPEGIHSSELSSISDCVVEVRNGPSDQINRFVVFAIDQMLRQRPRAC